MPKPEIRTFSENTNSLLNTSLLGPSLLNTSLLGPSFGGPRGSAFTREHLKLDVDDESSKENNENDQKLANRVRFAGARS